PGMAEGRVAQIVAERQGLGQVLMEPQGAGNRTGDLADLERMGQAIAEMPAFVMQENLRLVLKPAEGGGMDDAVAVALEFGTRRAGAGAVKAAQGQIGPAGIGGGLAHVWSRAFARTPGAPILASVL